MKSYAKDPELVEGRHGSAGEGGKPSAWGQTASGRERGSQETEILWRDRRARVIFKQVWQVRKGNKYKFSNYRARSLPVIFLSKTFVFNQ
jgi:hypothetical protein